MLAKSNRTKVHTNRKKNQYDQNMLSTSNQKNSCLPDAPEILDTQKLGVAQNIESGYLGSPHCLH